MNDLGEIFTFPKWAKISLAILSIVAILLLVATFILQSWADSQVESANLTFSKIDRNKSFDNVYAYKARVHFPRLDFLLRSRTISHIDLEKIAWASGIDSSAIQSIETHNRLLDFTTTQMLDSSANLGIMSYKMDFSPLKSAIIKYYMLLMLLFVLALHFYNVFNNEIKRFIEILNGESLPNLLWHGYKSINPLYRHTFWIVFIACNIVFGFDTAQFLWGAESWHFTHEKIGGNWATFQGRWTQNIVLPYLTQDLILPILNNVLAFFAISVASILLCIYLNITRKLWIWVIIGFCLTLSPFTLGRMFFTYQVAGLFIAVAVGILGFILARKAGDTLVKNGGGGDALMPLS